jgi:hypothetical protein
MEKSKNNNSDEKDGILAEYKTLRDEIISAKGRRLQTVSLTVGAVGAILSIIAGAVLGSDIPSIETRFAISIGGGIALYGVLIPSEIMTTHLQQTIQRIGSYIRVFIEPKVSGLNWENRWNAHKSQHSLPKGLGGIGGIFYFLSLLPLLLPLYLISQGAQNWLMVFVLVPFILWSFYLSYDMQAAISKGWKWQWESDIKKLAPKRKRANKAFSETVSSGWRKS